MNLRKKILAALTAAALAATAVPFAAFADDTAEEENVVELLDIADEPETEPVVDSMSVELLETTADTDWYDDSETEFTVSTAEQLLGVASIVNAGTDTFEGKTITIDADELNLEDISWTAIGSSSTKSFKGTLDGNGCKIINIGKNLFGYIGAGATVKDLDITLADSNTAYYGFATCVYGSTSALTTIDGITVNGTITGAAGLIGATYGTTVYSNDIKDTEVLISNCVNNAAVTTTGSSGIGGIVNLNSATSVYFKNCVNNGTLTATVNDGTKQEVHIGGIVRYVNGSYTQKIDETTSYTYRPYKTTLENCSNTGTINTYQYGSDTRTNVGGMLSTANGGEYEFINCSNSGSITGTINSSSTGGASCVGALAGKFNGYTCIVNGFTNTGDITATALGDDKAYAGGVVAYTDNSSKYHVILDSAVSSSINAKAESGTAYEGYIIGYISKKNTTTVLGSYEYTGTDEGLDDIGGMYSGTSIVYAVASVTDTDENVTYYDSLSDAITAASDGGTVTLVDDVSLTDTLTIEDGAELTLDLNGFTISSSADTAISNAGTLTIADSDGNGAVTATGTTLISSTGTLTITGGYYNTDLAEYVADGYYQTDSDDNDYTYMIKSVEDGIENDDDGKVKYDGEKTLNTGDAEITDDSAASVTTDDAAMITGNAVYAEFVSVSNAYTDALLANNSTIQSITVSRRDEITSYAYDSATGELSMDIEPYIVYNVDGDETMVPLDLYGIDATVNIPVDSNFTDGDSVKVKHDISTGGAEIMDGTVSGTSVSVETNQGFSTWTIYASGNASDESAEKISVVYTPVSDAEDNKAYYINLVGDGEIYRFMSAQLVFEIDNDAVGYTIEPYTCDDYAIEITTADTAVGTDTATVYEFNLNGDDVTGITAQKGVTKNQSEYIPIGIVTFAGVGEFTFGVDGDYGENQVQTAEGNSSTTVDNNIVRTYVTTDSSISGSDNSTLVANAKIDGSVNLAETTLTVNVMFPNAVTAQSIAYTQMSVEYSNVMGGDTVELGNDHSGDDYEDMDITEIISDINADNWTGYTFEITVPTGYVTNLTFKGDGYRTYRTSITPTAEDASVTVWNNVMDDEATVVTVNDDNQKTAQTTFLAGDIVANNVIDLYDLSAVVSYFGKTGMASDPDTYASDIQYDLNRDGKIDSKDIAMVLVSWGK